MNHGASLAERNGTGMGALISAANGGNIEVVKLLLQRVAMEGSVRLKPTTTKNCSRTLMGSFTSSPPPLSQTKRRGGVEQPISDLSAR